MSALRLHWGKVGAFGLVSIAGCNAVLGIEDYSARPPGGAGSGGDSVGGGAGTSSSGGEAGDSTTAGMGGDDVNGGSGGSDGGSAGKGGSAGSEGGSGGSIDPCGSGPVHAWATWRMPTPPSLALQNAQSYTPQTISPDILVRDDITDLVWQQSIPSGAVNWDGAKAYCETLSLGGACDWRLPSRIELVSILDYTKAPPFINTAFPGTPEASFWSSSPSAADDTKAWLISFSNLNSLVYEGSVADLHRVRCVRGESAVELEHYSVDSGLPGTAYDNETELRWQLAEDHGDWPANLPYYCDMDTTGGFTDWRLPSFGELSTLVDESRTEPSIDVTVFPITTSLSYGTPFSSGENYLSVHFMNGRSAMEVHDTYNTISSRCVRP